MPNGTPQNIWDMLKYTCGAYTVKSEFAGGLVGTVTEPTIARGTVTDRNTELISGLPLPPIVNTAAIGADTASTLATGTTGTTGTTRVAGVAGVAGVGIDYGNLSYSGRTANLFIRDEVDRVDNMYYNSYAPQWTSRGTRQRSTGGYSMDHQGNLVISPKELIELIKNIENKAKLGIKVSVEEIYGKADRSY